MRLMVAELSIADHLKNGSQEVGSLAQRLDGVLQTLYLLFNEGYKASVGEQLIREELCHEAIRLVTLLAEHPAGNQPRAHALLALMLLNGARLPTRVDADATFCASRSRTVHSGTRR
jgi:predicted RNA polymerase sigma factor